MIRKENAMMRKVFENSIFLIEEDEDDEGTISVNYKHEGVGIDIQVAPLGMLVSPDVLSKLHLDKDGDIRVTKGD